jgi:hypothetical protein
MDLPDYQADRLNVDELRRIKDMSIAFPDVDESGNTPLENALSLPLAYVYDSQLSKAFERID